MTEKRFIVEKNKNGNYEINKNDIAYYNFKKEKLLAELICGELISLVEENEQLKQRLNDFKHEIHRLKHELKCATIDSDFATQLEFQEIQKENEQLKKELRKQSKKCTQNIMVIKEENEHLKLQLDYIQSSITEAIKHSKRVRAKSLEKGN